MQQTLLLAILLGVAISAPTPQLMNKDAISAPLDTILVSLPLDVTQNIPAAIPSTPIPPITVSNTKRDAIHNEKRNGTCVPQPSGSGNITSPDTAEAFSENPIYGNLAENTQTPDGYSLVFSNLNGSLSASKYMGLYTLKAYDSLACQSKCDQAQGCQAFNLYVERDPSLDPNANQCPNPPSTTNYKCTLWGAPVSSAEATNYGQWRESFHVVIAGSNAYNKNSLPSAIAGYTGPNKLGGAINAPLDSNGHDTYMGYKFFPSNQSQGYTPQTCANACNLQTTYNSQHSATNGSYQSCVFFNSYILSKNTVPQGLYCSLYNETWSSDYGNNYGQYRGSDRYTVSESYSYSRAS